MWIRTRIWDWLWDFPKKNWIPSFPSARSGNWWEERTEATPDNRFYKLNPKVDDIPEKYGRTCNGVKLLVLGTVETANSGCVCPEHVMLKRIINNLVLHRDDVVILDMEAGLEHLGRGTTEGMDYFVVVIEPGARSSADLQKCQTSGGGPGYPSGSCGGQQSPG